MKGENKLWFIRQMVSGSTVKVANGAEKYYFKTCFSHSALLGAFSTVQIGTQNSDAPFFTKWLTLLHHAVLSRGVGRRGWKNKLIRVDHHHS